jgi:hypothetical protein
MSQSQINSGLFVGGTLSAEFFTPPKSCIDNDAVQGNANIDYTKLQQKHVVRYSQKAGTAIVSETVPIHIADATGELVSIEVVCITPPTTSDTVTVDLQAGNVSTAYASILTSVVTLDSSSITRTVYDSSFATPDYAAGDSFEIVVTATGSSAQGLLVVVTFAQNPL